MADTDIIVSQMPNASQVGNSDLVMLTQPNAQAETGYSTAKTTVGALATKVGNGIEFVTDLSRFTDKTLTGAINENKDSILDLLPVDEVSGAVANFDTDVVLPLIDVKAEIKALETGTGAKSPSNPYVISGFNELALTLQSGKNLWDEQWEEGLIDAATGNNTPSTSYSRTKNYIPVKSGVAYYFCPLAKTLYLRLYDKNQSYLGYRQISANNVVGRTQTFESNIAYIRFCWDGQTYNNDISVNYPATDTSYHASTGIEPTKYTFALGQTVYGGELDVINGNLKITHAIKKFSELTWGSSTWGSSTAFSATLSDAKSNSTSTLAGLVCEMYNEVTPGSMYSSNNDAICLNGTILRLRDNNFSTFEEWKQATADCEVVYPLATPIEIDVIPQAITPILGVNNVWNDTNGDTTVKYKLGIQAYIDKKIAEVQALVL